MSFHVSWAFGIVLYEMHTMGEAPFPEVEAQDLLQYLLGGNRPPKPLMASDKLCVILVNLFIIMTVRTTILMRVYVLMIFSIIFKR